MRGGDHILKLLTGEDIGGGEVTFGVTVLSGLGDGDVEDLAGLSLDHDVAVVIIKCRSLIEGEISKKENVVRTDMQCIMEKMK